MKGLIWCGLCCLMTPGLSKDIQCHVSPYVFLILQITRSDIRLHIPWTVSLVIAYCPFNPPQWFVWVRMGQHAHFVTTEEGHGRNDL